MLLGTQFIYSKKSYDVYIYFIFVVLIHHIYLSSFDMEALMIL